MINDRKTAVALQYPEDADAPFIAASAKGKLAEKIIQIAEENNVPVVENDMLANVLSVQDIGASIPEETWHIVAEIFAFIIRTEEKDEKFYQDRLQ